MWGIKLGFHMAAQKRDASHCQRLVSMGLSVNAPDLKIPQRAQKLRFYSVHLEVM